MSLTTDQKLVRYKIIGLLIALVAPVVYSLWFGPRFIKPATTPLGYTLISFAVYWALALGLMAFTRLAEGSSLASLGIKVLSWRMLATALGLGLLLSITVPLLTLLAVQVLPSAESGSIISTANRYPPWAILLSVLTAGVTEELFFRAYAFERLLQLTNNTWISAFISLAGFVLIHWPGWNLAHIVGVVLPLGLILTVLYVWRRNLIFVIIIHILVDLPLFFFALAQ